MDDNLIFITKSQAETKKLGEKFAQVIYKEGSDNLPVCLYGDLASGKTTLFRE